MGKKRKREDAIADLDAIYDHFPCACLKKFSGAYSLGLCVSVLQYMDDKDCELTLRSLAKHCDFLYFDVVTSEEYEIMSNGGSQFKDAWAISRSKLFYWKILFKHFRMVSNMIWESKYFYPTTRDSNIPNTLYLIDEDMIKALSAAQSN